MIRTRHLALAGIFCVLLYAPGLAGPLVFDSTVALESRALMKFDPAVFDDWRVVTLSSDTGPLGRPVSMFSFALDYALFGDSSLALKASNLLLHLCIGGLAFVWLRRLLANAPTLMCESRTAEVLAFAAAFLWLINPMQVSTVLYSVQRMEQLSTLFVLAGLFVFTHYRCRWLATAATAVELSNALLLIALCGALAIFSKEDGVLLIPLIALVEVLLFRGRYAGRTRTWLVVSCALLCIVPVLGVVVLAALEPRFLVDWYGWRPWSPQQRLLTQARVLWDAVSWFYWPDITRMSLFHDDIPLSRSLLEPISTLVAVVAWLGVVAAALAALRRTVIPAFCVGFFVFSHGLESSIIPLDLVYEHRSYMGNLALSLLLVWSIYRLLPARSLPVLGVTATLVFSTSLLFRSYEWGDELRLNDAQLRHHPESARAAYRYASLQMKLADGAEDELQTREHVLQARRYFEYLLELEPESFPALVSLVYIDSRWFPELPVETWLAKLDKLATHRIMQPPDINALKWLTRCIIRGSCNVEEERFVALIQSLSVRYPTNPVYPRYLASYYGMTARDLTKAIRYSEWAVAMDEGSAASKFDLISWRLASGEQGDALLVMGSLLERDRHLEYIQELKKATP